MAEEQKNPEDAQAQDELDAIEETIEAEGKNDVDEADAENITRVTSETTSVDPMSSDETSFVDEEIAEEVIEEEAIAEVDEVAVVPEDVADEAEAAPEEVVAATDPDDEASVTPDYDLEEEQEAADELEPETAFEESVEAAIETAAEVSKSEPVQAVDSAIEGVMDDLSETAEQGVDMTTEHHYSDTFVIPYTEREMTLPGGIYTFVFGVLAALTAFEVLITIILPEGNFFAVIMLVTASLIKALLVVAYYMHLNTDNPIFRVVLLVPLLIVLISVLYLLGVPVNEGLGYQ